MVAETVKESLLKSESILEAVYEAEKKLSSYKRKNPSTEYMSTTIAVTEILDNGILVSWAGDSRVYQFRDGKIIFMTSDYLINWKDSSIVHANSSGTIIDLSSIPWSNSLVSFSYNLYFN